MSKPVGSPDTGAEQYEYRTDVVGPFFINGRLNKMAQKGWEVVSSESFFGKSRIIWRRPVGWSVAKGPRGGKHR